MDISQQADLGVVFALSYEAGCFVDMLSGVRVTRGDGFIARTGHYHGRPIALVESGPGPLRAARAVQALLDAYQPRLVVAAGYAGGLDPRVKRHDLIVADSLLNAAGEEIALDPAAVAPWYKEMPDLHRGRLLTLDRIVRSSDEKRQLGERHQALAVDMESFAVAEVCRQRAIDPLVIRAVTDAVTDELPSDIGRLLARETFAGQIGAAIGSVFRRPAAAKDLFGLYQSSLEASSRLAKFLAKLIEHLPSKPDALAR